MKRIKPLSIVQFIFILLNLWFNPSISRGQQIGRKIELTNFRLQSSAINKTGGSEISSASYKSKNYWFPVKVPSTVLAGLVANKVYPSPYFGMNNMFIPDASDSFNTKYHLSQYSFLPNNKNPWKDPYWYRTTFKLPKSYEGKHIWLTFKGINYRAAVWLNGKQVSDSSRMVGMFAQYHFDVTDKIKFRGVNALAVEIYPLDYPGEPSPPQLKAFGPFFKNGGTTGDIGKNVTMLCSVGWDWVPAARGREMGIWQPVYLSDSGPVTINEPHIVTNLPNLPDTSKATITISAKLKNHSKRVQKGKLFVTIRPYNFEGSSIHISKNENLKPEKSRLIELSPEKIKELRIRNPHLWWPNGNGKANLYQVELRYKTDNEISDVSNTIIGIRTVSSKVTNVNGWDRRDFYINGRKIPLVGGAWVPDLMLKRSAARYSKELELIKNSNLNLVRIWGGGIAPPDDFFRIADEDGLMVWQDFWITGDTQGGFKGSDKWPLQGDVFVRNMKSTIIRLRNHASLLLWTGGNEGHPRKDLYDAMRKNVAELDGTRPFISSSSGWDKLPKGWKGSWPDNKEPGFYSGGPYSWQDPVQYYKFVHLDHDWIFKDETGIPSQPPFNSLSKIIPDLVPDTTLPFPLNNTWGYHDACAGNGKYQTYYKAIVDRYGKARSFRDYSKKAQLVNANGYRAIFESVNSKMNETGGVMLWKINSAWPSVMWQLYDWYLEPNAGYYYVQKASEPLHVQFNLNDSTVVVVNRQYHIRKNLTVRMMLYDINSREWYNKSSSIDAGEHSVTKVASLKSVMESHKQLTFVDLSVTDINGKTESHNFYWLAPGNNFKPLQDMPMADVEVSVKRIAEAGKPAWKVILNNPTDKIAFFVRAQLMVNHGKKEVLPSYWSNNYINLAPHEKTVITVRTEKSKWHQIHQIVVDGWNTQKVVENAD